MKEKIEEVAHERLHICDLCEWHSETRKLKGWKTVRPDEHCTSCGCTLSAKTRCLSCSCPKGHWSAVMDLKDEEVIRKDIPNEQ